jgi:hypothetical protein
MATLHPSQVAWIAECSNMLMLMAIGTGDTGTVRSAVDRIASTADHGAERRYVDRAHGVRLLLDGRPRDAAQALEALRTPTTPATPWFIIQGNIDLDLLIAAAHLQAGARHTADVVLARAYDQLEQIASQMPRSTLAYRRFVLNALQSKGRATRP